MCQEIPNQTDMFQTEVSARFESSPELYYFQNIHMPNKARSITYLKNSSLTKANQHCHPHQQGRAVPPAQPAQYHRSYFKNQPGCFKNQPSHCKLDFWVWAGERPLREAPREVRLPAQMNSKFIFRQPFIDHFDPKRYQ